jgi:metallo-beta-lactamase family protein
MLTVQFCGAARTVTGSQYFLEYTGNDGSKFNFAIDSGMFQVGGKVNLFKVNSHLVFEPTKLDAIVLTHAHLDHCGRIPYLVKMGFGGKIYSTPTTKQIAEVVMTDAAKLSTDPEADPTHPGAKSFYFPVKNMDAQSLKQEKFSVPSLAKVVENPKYSQNLQKENVGLYELYDVEQAMTRFITNEYHQVFDIHPNISVEFCDAGHILGSAYVIIKEKSTGRTIVFSGDLGNINKPIIKDPEMPQFQNNLTHIFIETTYGNRLHGKLDPKSKLRDFAFNSLNSGGKLLIPAFSIERCQEVIYFLTELMRENKIPKTPIYLDSPMGSKVLSICLEHEELYDAELKQKIRDRQNPLIYSELKILDTADQSKTLNTMKDPCIIIAGSGMCNGGRILKHFLFNLENSENTVLLVGYQAEGTLGRELLDGKPEVTIEEKALQVKAKIGIITEFSAHADQLGLKNWISHLLLNDSEPELKPTVFLMHGEKESSTKFGEEVENNFPGKVKTYWPYFAEKVTLWE